jgi:hypothetical protein
MPRGHGGRGVLAFTRMVAEQIRVAELRQGWRDAERDFFAFLDGIGATEDAYTVTIRLAPRRIESPQQFADWLNPQTAADGTWAFLTTSPDASGVRHGFAMPVTRWRPEDALGFPFVEIHTVLVAWWLTTAWRARQLVRAASALTDSGDAIAAAACVRPLVETAAAFWVDGRKVIEAWDEIKRAGSPASDEEAFGRRSRLMRVLNELTWGAKFDERAPELKRLWGRVSRSNVLGQVEKLGRATSGDLQADYQWLCNTVHPSIGNTFAFSAPPLVHRTRTHWITGFAGRPIHVEDGHEVHAELTVQTATARGAAVAVRVLWRCLDAMLRTIDDLALTTNAPAIARESYWRNLTTPGRNELCPCRSGRKVKRCLHQWGDSSPGFPSDFDDVATPKW